MSNLQEAINGYIESIRFKIECVSYGFRDVEWDKLTTEPEETLRKLHDLDELLVNAIRLIPEERTVRSEGH